ncbi:MAG: hypothetical protein AAFO04_28535 [Cyanobacteria bacterium J06592_8]
MLTAQFTRTLLKNKVLTVFTSLGLCTLSTFFFSPVVQADTPVPVQTIKAKIKPKLSIPILLPSAFPSGRGRVYFKEKVNSQGYYINFMVTPNCQTKLCTHGRMSAETWGISTPPPPKSDPRNQYQTVVLANGIEGQYYNGCDVYCTALVEWRYQNILYRVTLKNGSLEDLKAIANSAIQAGPR